LCIVQTVVLDAAAEERVHDLKMRALQQNMPLLSVWLGEADCYMRTNAKPMRDDRLVADYADGNQCLLAHMHMRQKGGCFMISKCLAARQSAKHFASYHHSYLLSIGLSATSK
jgi:hypothetical protein